MNRPYRINHDNSVHVVRHNNPFAQPDGIVPLRFRHMILRPYRKPLTTEIQQNLLTFGHDYGLMIGGRHGGNVTSLISREKECHMVRKGSYSLYARNVS